MLYELSELEQHITENPDALNRVLGEDGRVDWHFVERCSAPGRRLNPVEREIAALEYYGRLAVLRKLEELGAIEIIEEPADTGYTARRTERDRVKSLSARSRRTTSR